MKNNKVIKIALIILIVFIVLGTTILLITKKYSKKEQTFINLNANTNSNLNTNTKTNTNNNTSNDNALKFDPYSIYDYTTEKPIIYIYTTKKIKVSVKLGNLQCLSCTYPKYTDEWNVIANSDGTLIDLATNRKLYALYWEGKNLPKNTDMTEGFCIKGEDTAKFLEEKLGILGLNERETEEFIIYWLPKMERNKYNYIRFETIEEQNNAMPLTINPKPDNLIRVMMDWKELDNKIELKEQVLNIPKREGYTVVEWGGSELK